MCKTLSRIYCKIMSIFPSLEAARPRSKSGIQALCSLHVALEKSKNVLQHCSQCSKLYLVGIPYHIHLSSCSGFAPCNDGSGGFFLLHNTKNIVHG